MGKNHRGADAVEKTRDRGEKRGWNCCLTASQKSPFLLRTGRVFFRTTSLELPPLQPGGERSLEEVHLTGSSTGWDGGLRICRKHRRSNQILLFVLAERLKYQQKRKRWSRCSISMGRLLAAAFLILPCACLSSGASQQSQLPKRHTAAPQRAGAGACARQQNDGCNARQVRETPVSSLEELGLAPLWGKEPCALGC